MECPGPGSESLDVPPRGVVHVDARAPQHADLEGHALDVPHGHSAQGREGAEQVQVETLVSPTRPA